MTTDRIARRQHGAALLLMMLVVLVAATAALVTRLNMNDARAMQQMDAQDVLADAKRALLDYAVVVPDMAPGEPAKLPCPDIDGGGGLMEGEAHATSCGARGVSVMGRLPWRTLGIAAPRDSAGACLWYVVSGSHKDAETASAEMVNDDSHGQLQLFGVESRQLIAGASAAERPIAIVIAPMHALPGQTRSAPAPGDSCSASFSAADFLDSDAGTGISNATVTGTADTIDMFAVSSGFSAAHNDRVVTISPADFAVAITERHDHDATMRSLGLAIAECVAEYARNNPGGSDDRRMPWPAPLGLADYRDSLLYDDTNTGVLSGRMPDLTGDSSALTGNSILRVLSDCDSIAVPAWSPAMLALWRNWKDHVFYAVAESFAPVAPVPSTCTTCLTVNGAGQFAAVIAFSGGRLPPIGQTRDAPPIDSDTRNLPGNYLEDANAGNFPYLSGTVDFASLMVSSTFNDSLFCIDAALNVTVC